MGGPNYGALFWSLFALVIGLALSTTITGATSAPSAPERAYLSVIASDSIEVSIEPPLTDGGSPIMAYTIEWDKEPGVPEVQRVSTSLDLGSNEIQSITTSLPDINEVQILQSSAVPVGEVLTITVSPRPSEISIGGEDGYVLRLDTTATGGSMQYSGRIGATAPADGSRTSMTEIIGNMSNMVGRPSVIKRDSNADGGHTYTVTFPTSMGNIPTVEVFVSDLPVKVEVLEEGNVLGGTFRLEFEGEITTEIPANASASVLQSKLESISTIGSLAVSRSRADDQGGYSWKIEFVSNKNGGNVKDLIVRENRLSTSNASAGSASLEVVPGGVNGTYIEGFFVIEFDGEKTFALASDSSASDVKAALEDLFNIGKVDVTRSSGDLTGGYSWKISFLEDGTRIHRGDMPPFGVESLLTDGGSASLTPAVVVDEVRKGTSMEVQTITIAAGGSYVDPTSSYRLRFLAEETSDILALPAGGTTCLGSTTAKQIIKTSTDDTSGEGGDSSVSPLTTFNLLYEGRMTDSIFANAIGESCESVANTIAHELERIPPLYSVIVSGRDSAAGDEGCEWAVTFVSVVGNPDLLQVVAQHGAHTAGPSTSVTVGVKPSVVRDTIEVMQPPELQGDYHLIQSELSKLSGIGLVSVTSDTVVPDSNGQCHWHVTFESNAGNVAPFHVSKSGSSDFGLSAKLNSGDVVMITDDEVRGTSKPLSGDFTLSLNGEVTEYLPYDVSADALEYALEALDEVGDVDVTRHGPDVNGCCDWDITFLSNLGPLPILAGDDLDLKGTGSAISATKQVVGVAPPFNGTDYGSRSIIELSYLSAVISPLTQGVPYYFRVTASNALGSSLAVASEPPLAIPFPRSPSPPSYVDLEAKDGSTLTLVIGEPKHNGGEIIDKYRVNYGTKEFHNEKQRISLTCSPESEVQTLTTYADDINEVQYIILDSSYMGNGVTHETQRVNCDATGGTFGLVIRNETVYFDHDADAISIRKGFESLLGVDSVSIQVDSDGGGACAPYNEATGTAGSFSVTFLSLLVDSSESSFFKLERSSLEGATRVDMETVTNYDAPIEGRFRMSFRGALSRSVDTSLSAQDLALEIQSALQDLDTVENDGLVVSVVDLPNGGKEKIFSVEFVGYGVGGNVVSIRIPSGHNFVRGSGAEVFVIADGEGYKARNGIDFVTSRIGNVLSGSFQLRLRGHITDDIPFNASDDELKDRLEALPNVGRVSVQAGIGKPTKEYGYTWTITFLANRGYFPPFTRNVDVLDFVSSLTTSVPNDSSADIFIETLRDGDDPLGGTFQLSFSNGITTASTRPLESFISAARLETELERLANVGDVSVSRLRSDLGYHWDVEFVGCSVKSGADVCNDGNLLLLNITSVDLTGCGEVALEVSEIQPGNGADVCLYFPSGRCSDVRAIEDVFPVSHELEELELGKTYFVQTRYHNSHGYGLSLVSSPVSVFPSHNPPGAPPPIHLRESTAKSLTLSWEPPWENGGKRISGYELWMDEWSGGNRVMVYDGAGRPDKLTCIISTRDLGIQSQVVEFGRQYQFQLRAINNCSVEDPDRACYGTFSKVQVFTVRDPRRPLPPAAPLRDARTNVSGPSGAAISIMWSPPVDNGGSPITGYILYIKHPDDKTDTLSLGPEVTLQTIQDLDAGKLYRFYIVAVNSVGRSPHSPVLTVVAAVCPGKDMSMNETFATASFRPTTTAIEEHEITVEWSSPASESTGGTPITGYRLYMYESVGLNTKSNPEPVRQEVQDIHIVGSDDSIGGVFTVLFRGEESSPISVDASALDMKYALENLDSINALSVQKIQELWWRVTFLSEPGNLPLFKTKSGRLVGSEQIRVIATEHISGDPAVLVYDGAGSPSTRRFVVMGLVPGAKYAFKVAPMNAVGDGILSLASMTAIARAGASAKFTTASGSALSKGIVGYIQEVQVVVFASNDCDADGLILSFGSGSIDHTSNLCDESSWSFEAAIEALPGVGDVRVTRKDLFTIGGSKGYAWSVTFLSFRGGVAPLQVDLTRVNNGKDASDWFGEDAVYVSEFLREQANEITIEPKKASGAAVRDIAVSNGMAGTDIFFSELWKSDGTVLDGSHDWYSDGGLAVYNSAHYEKQEIFVPVGVGTFHLIMDTTYSSAKSTGRIGGILDMSSDLNAENLTEALLQDALGALRNVGGVLVSSSPHVDPHGTVYTVTFVTVLGEMPLLDSSEHLVVVSRQKHQIGVAEVQTITSAADKKFIYEIQSVAIAASAVNFTLSFDQSSDTNPILCDFESIIEAQNAASILQVELEGLASKVSILVNTESTGGDGSDADPWTFRITFLEPLGPLPLLESDKALVSRLVQGKSNMLGTMVLSYDGKYTDDISYSDSAEIIKEKLENLSTIEEVDVRKIDRRNGYQWEVTFTRAIGNLPSIIAHTQIFEIQKIKIAGGHPTPLGGYFQLFYGEHGEETTPLAFDSSAGVVKSALEALALIDYVDIDRVAKVNGQYEWSVTFRRPQTPDKLGINVIGLTGTLDTINTGLSTVVTADPISLVASSGGNPRVDVKEKVAGLPSYTARYFADKVGTYSLAILQLQNGGLSAKYYDNQWLLDDPVMETVDPSINFRWGDGPLTPYGRDFVSIRWWGKIQPTTTEEYTFFVKADDGFRLYIDHELLIDAWNEVRDISGGPVVVGNEMRASFGLSQGTFHDLRFDYREITGEAYVELFWGSSSIRKQAISPSQLFHPTHISASPFPVQVAPGATDYAHSDFVDIPTKDRTRTVAGEPTHFVIQARDFKGNDKSQHGGSQGDFSSPRDQFVVDITSERGVVLSGAVEYIGSGRYRVDYMLNKAGSYIVSVKTRGTDIHCGRGVEEKCSPFKLFVEPGSTVPSMTEAESLPLLDSLVEARAGERGLIFVQAKDAYGNNRSVGGDQLEAIFANKDNEIQYRGNVFDEDDGSYQISFSIPVAGFYSVSLQLGGQPIKTCVGVTGLLWYERAFDGIGAYTAPSFCRIGRDDLLRVIHHDLHTPSSIIVETSDYKGGLSAATVGVETGFQVQARDKFGNLRYGAKTSHLDALGDGSSDVFLAIAAGPGDTYIRTSSAVQVITSSDSSLAGSFRLEYGNATSLDLPHDICAPALQAALAKVHSPNAQISVTKRTDSIGNSKWEVTFLSHLDKWLQKPLTVVPASTGGGTTSVHKTISVMKAAHGGLYPMRYTAWITGVYKLAVTTYTGAEVSQSNFTIQVSDGPVRASSSIANGQGLISAIAGEPISFQIQARDKHRPEIQVIHASAPIIDLVHEIQNINIGTKIGNSFSLSFRGQRTTAFIVGTSTISHILEALEALPTISSVGVNVQVFSTSYNAGVIFPGDDIEVTFLGDHGDLPILLSTGSEIIHESVAGESPHRIERQVIKCNASGGEVTVAYGERTSVLKYRETVDSIESILSDLYSSLVSVVDFDGLPAVLCSSAGKVLFLDFVHSSGDLDAVRVIRPKLQGGTLVIYGDGQEAEGAVNGIHPVMGNFTLGLNDEVTWPIPVSASANKVREALEALHSIGTVIVSRDDIGYIHGVPLFPFWSVTFAVEGEGACQLSSWGGCPANIGDVPSLLSSSHGLFNVRGTMQQQARPTVEIDEVQNGSLGNNRGSNEDMDKIEVVIRNSNNAASGIGMAEIQTIRCSYTGDALLEGKYLGGNLTLQFLSYALTVDVNAPLSELEELLVNTIPQLDFVSTEGSSHGTICHFDPDDPVVASTIITFSFKDGPLPLMKVASSSGGVTVSTINNVDRIDGIESLGQGLYTVTYTATISGHYDIAIYIDERSIWSDLSAGVTVQPTRASALESRHDSKPIATEGILQEFFIQTKDIYGNDLRLPLEQEKDDLSVRLRGVPHKCSGQTDVVEMVAVIEYDPLVDSGGRYRVFYTPSLAGIYEMSVMLRSSGGLLATYYKNDDFTQGVRDKKDREHASYCDSSWCVQDPEMCKPTTRLDSQINFDWGFKSPLPVVGDFPIDYFSVQWKGHIIAPATDEYRFDITLNGGVRLFIGETVVVDTLPQSSYKTVSGTVVLDAGKFYPIKVEYMHSTDEALIVFYWSSTIFEREIVPRSVLYYTCHIGSDENLHPSPFSINVLPGAIDVSSMASGDGLNSCVATNKCSFEIQTKDSFGNNRFNDGKDPPFQISILGIEGWAYEGRVNDETKTLTGPVSVAAAVSSQGWLYLDSVTAEHGLSIVTTRKNLLNNINRGDTIVLEGHRYTVAMTGKFDAFSVPLDGPYLGLSSEFISLFKIDSGCLTGRHTATYTPLIRGKYEVDVKVPSDLEGFPQSIGGFPRFLHVEPDKTDPSWSTARGGGLSAAVAGIRAEFVIQAKDDYGNNQLFSSENDKFEIFVFPEGDDTNFIVGDVEARTNGAFGASYLPEKSGHHTVVIVQITSREIQTISTQYSSFARGGTFSLTHKGQVTPEISWNATATVVEEMLESLSTIDDVAVSKNTLDRYNFQYTVTFESAIGNVPELMVSVDSLLGNERSWTVSSLDGEFRHIMTRGPHDDNSEMYPNASLRHEVQRLTVEMPLESIDGATFTLGFRGRKTDPLPFDAATEDLLASLKQLDTVGEMVVVRDSESMTSNSWTITFTPDQGDDMASLGNFGNLPELLVQDYHDSVSAQVQTIHDGWSPFRVLVSPGVTSLAHCTATDFAGVDNYEGLSRGVYRSLTHFRIHLRDQYSNKNFVDVGTHGFLVRLSGQETVHGNLRYLSDGVYEASYVAPRVGEYSMRVEGVTPGLKTRLFSNRWLQEGSAEERVDHTIDFVWTDKEPLTTVGNHFVSARWTGYLLPIYNEVYTFSIHLNDGAFAKLWVGEDLIIKAGETTGDTPTQLSSNRMSPITLEYQAEWSKHLSLFWSSSSQLRELVHWSRFFQGETPIKLSPFSVSISPILPSAPRNLTATITGAESLLVEWLDPIEDGGENVTSYTLEVTEREGGRAVANLDVSNETKTHSYDYGAYFTQLKNLQPGVELLIKCFAKNSKGIGDPNSVVAIPMGRPGAVDSLTLERGPSSPSTIVVSFPPISDEKSNGAMIEYYSIEWSTDPLFRHWNEKKRIVVTKHSVTGFNPGQEYYFRVFGTNAMGNGPPSPEGTLTPGSEPDAVLQNAFQLSPLISSKTTSVAQSSTSLVATWTNPSKCNGFPLSGFLLEYWVSNEILSPSHRIVEIDNPNVNMYTLTDLTPGQPYSAKLSVRNSLGYSNPVLSVPEEMAPPRQAPSEPNSVRVGLDSGRSLRVLFSDPSSDGGDEISQYRIEWDENPTFTSSSGLPQGYYNKLASRCVPICEHVIFGLTRGTDYYVRIMAYNSFGYSAPSLSTPFKLSPVSLPSPPVEVNVSRVGSHLLQVSFFQSVDDGGAKITQYKIEWVEMGSIRDNALYLPYTVQTITVSDEAEDFSLSFHGHKTVAIQSDTSTHRLAQAISALPSIGTVRVTKKEGVDSNTFQATFPSYRNMEKILVNSADVSVEVVVRAYDGYEVQSIRARGRTEGSFRLAMSTHATDDIAFNATTSQMKASIESLNGVGRVEVRRKGVERFEWLVMFLESYAYPSGDVPLLRGLGEVDISETIKGRLPRIPAETSLEVDTDDTGNHLSRNITVNSKGRHLILVSALNIAGQGPSGRALYEGLESIINQ